MQLPIKVFICTLLFLIASPILGQKDTVYPETIRFNPSANFKSPIFSLPLYIYPFYNGKQLIEVGYYEQSLEQGSWEDAVHPRGGSSYWDAIRFNVPNGIIIRDSTGNFIATYGIPTTDLEMLKQRIFQEHNGKIIYHKERAKSLRTLNTWPEKGTWYELRGNGYIVRTDLAKQMDEDGGLFGVIDTLGNTRIPFQYESISFNIDAYLVCEKFNYGLYSDDFKMLLPTEYKSIQRINSNRYACQKENTEIIDVGFKKESTKQYEQIKVFRKELLAYQLGGKYGLMTKEGTPLTLPTYDWIDELNYGYQAVDQLGRSDIYNEQGSLILQVDGFRKLEYLEEIKCFKIEIYDRWFREHKLVTPQVTGLIDTTGKVVIPLEYTSIGQFINGLACARKVDSVYLVDKGGKVRYGMKGKNIRVTNLNRFVIEMDFNHLGLIDTLGQEILSPMYKQISCFDKDTIVLRTQNDSVELHLLTTKEQIPLAYFRVNCFQGGTTWAQLKSGSFYLIDVRGNKLTEAYDQVLNYIGPYYVVKRANLYGVLDFKGNEIVATSYTEDQLTQLYALLQRRERAKQKLPND